MQILKENDFAELDYTGRVADGGAVFDTTSAEAARKAGLFNKQTAYEPAIVCIGRRHLIPGLDRQLTGKEVGKDYTFKIAAEEAFGKRNAKLIQIMSTAKFRQQNIVPYPGLQVNIDGLVGTVRAVTGGRTIVDFNHPLSGKDVEYDVVVRKIVTDTSEKVNAVLKLVGIRPDAVSVSVSEGSASIGFPQEAPDVLKKDVEEKLKSAIPDIKSVSFSVKAKNENAAKEAPPQQ